MNNSGKSKKKDQDINVGKKYSMRSKVLKEERPYWVYLPNSYDEGNKKQRYPVLYLLDGDAHFQSASGVVQFMSSGINGNCQIPEMFEYNISNFPKSSNVYDSLGEAYMIKGDKAQAIKNYKKSLKLDPDNQNAARMIREPKEKKETSGA